MYARVETYACSKTMFRYLRKKERRKEMADVDACKVLLSINFGARIQMFVESLYATNEKEREKEKDNLINISMHHNCYYAVIIEK